MPYPDNHNAQAFEKAWGASKLEDNPYLNDADRARSMYRVLKEQAEVMAARLSTFRDLTGDRLTQEMHDCIGKAIDHVTDMVNGLDDDIRGGLIFLLEEAADDLEKEAL